MAKQSKVEQQRNALKKALERVLESVIPYRENGTPVLSDEVCALCNKALGLQPPGHPTCSTTNEERYYHFQKDDNLEFAETKFRAMTVFARYEKGALGVQGWHMAVALCNREDSFDRKAGRQIARRRYFTSPRNRHPVGANPLHELNYDEVATLAFRVLAGAAFPPGHAKPYPTS